MILSIPCEHFRRRFDRLGHSQALSSLEWCSADPRRVGATAQRVSRGGFDLVIVNKFVRHRDSMRVADAAKAVGVPVIVVRRGFGTSAIREAIEHSRGSRRSHQ